MSMRTSSSLAAVALLVIAPCALAQQAPDAGEDLQAKCYAGRTELERLYSTLTDIAKQGIVAEALEEIMEIEEDADWRACLHEVEATLAAIK